MAVHVMLDTPKESNALLREVCMWMCGYVCVCVNTLLCKVCMCMCGYVCVCVNALLHEV